MPHASQEVTAEPRGSRPHLYSSHCGSSPGLSSSTMRILLHSLAPGGPLDRSHPAMSRPCLRQGIKSGGTGSDQQKGPVLL